MRSEELIKKISVYRMSDYDGIKKCQYIKDQNNLVYIDDVIDILEGNDSDKYKKCGICEHYIKDHGTRNRCELTYDLHSRSDTCDKWRMMDETNDKEILDKYFNRDYCRIYIWLLFFVVIT
jgi:hypothetical protein